MVNVLAAGQVSEYSLFFGLESGSRIVEHDITVHMPSNVRQIQRWFLMNQVALWIQAYHVINWQSS